MKQDQTKNIKPLVLKDKNARPENKDNLDHREGEEQDFKGDDVTHNKKETKSEKHKQDQSRSGK